MSAWLVYDGSYLRTVSGILKICNLICGILGFGCIVFSSVHLSNVRGSCYMALALLTICCSASVLLTRLFWQRKFYNFDAVKYELYLNVFFALSWFVISAMVLSLHMLSYTIAAFFGLLAFCFYTYDACLGYRLHRQTDAATQTTNVI